MVLAAVLVAVVVAVLVALLVTLLVRLPVQVVLPESQLLIEKLSSLDHARNELEMIFSVEKQVFVDEALVASKDAAAEGNAEILTA